MIKTAKFFCEHCGTEVRQNAKVCKKCGRFFSLVRCPMCGKSGEAMKFTHGCPFCGYAFRKQQPAGTDDIYGKSVAVRRHDPLPAWLYVVCAGALVGLLGGLIISGF